MEHVSTYSRLGIPDSVAAALLMICLSLLLAPWLGGLEIGPLKIPKISAATARVLRYLAPVLVIAVLGGFYPTWERKSGDEKSDEVLLVRETDLAWLETSFGGTKWRDDASWGIVIFDSAGRTARYSNVRGRSAGSIVVSPNAAPGSGFIMFNADWVQDDGSKGEMTVLATPYEPGSIFFLWGPDNAMQSQLKLQE